jgi:glucan biosynthesis protein C
MSASLPLQRYHALDALRATMMLLGLVLHSAVSYTARPLGAAWPYHDPHTSPWFDLIVFFIHLFRMPVFFVVAGFFGALLYDRDGASGMARNRLRRVLAPLALGWVVLYPLTAAGFVFALGRGATADAPGWEYLTSGAFLTQANLIHLWFLYDLLLLYAAAVVGLPLLRRMPTGLRRGVEATFGRLVTSAWGPLAWSGATALTLVPIRHIPNATVEKRQPVVLLRKDGRHQRMKLRRRHGRGHRGQLREAPVKENLRVRLAPVAENERDFIGLRVANDRITRLH